MLQKGPNPAVYPDIAPQFLQLFDQFLLHIVELLDGLLHEFYIGLHFLELILFLFNLSFKLVLVRI